VEAPLEADAKEVARLRACLNDLVSLMGLPALWAGREPSHIASTLLDALVEMLPLDFGLVRLNNQQGGPPIEEARVVGSFEETARAHDLGQVLALSLGDDPLKWPPGARVVVGGVELSVAVSRLGVHGDMGVFVAGCHNSGFPGQAEKLLLDVAANQAAIGIEQARRLRDSERNSRQLVDSIPGLVALLTTGGEVEFVNRQILEYTGRPLEQLKQWGTNDIVHPEDLPHVAQAFTQSIISGTPYEIVQRLRRWDGAYLWFRNNGFPLRDASGNILCWCVLLTDIDERRRAEEALTRARADLAHVARVTTLSALAASIAHEVNQPLSGIITNAGTCLRMLAHEPPDIDGARETARRTIRDGKRASDVVARLRALFSRKDATLEPVNLNEATREVFALSSNELTRGRILTRLELAEHLPAVTGDRVQLQQVILNLLLNASEAMSAVDDRPRQLVIRTGLEGTDRVRLSVEDAGVGVEPGEVERLFEAFYTTKSGGMGIGLSVSQFIIENHRGRLWAEPNDGPGAMFCFSIPCGRATHER
jgi:PAS domain S-box-containing protein